MLTRFSNSVLWGVERLAELALAFSGASDETENLTGNGQNVLML